MASAQTKIKDLYFGQEATMEELTEGKVLERQRKDQRVLEKMTKCNFTQRNPTVASIERYVRKSQTEIKQTEYMLPYEFQI